MNLLFAPQTNVSEIKQQFHALFPYLKIEFFTVSHQNQQGSPAKHIIEGNTLLNKLNPAIAKEELQLNPLLLVSEFEQAIKVLFNLNVQVFRRSKSTWIETTKTDNWTLAKQNLAGQESMSPTTEEEKTAYEDLDVS